MQLVKQYILSQRAHSHSSSFPQTAVTAPEREIKERKRTCKNYCLQRLLNER